jgi:hypothetical protein
MIERMIIVKLQGGLGNQMFQYALGYSLSKLYNTAVKFDLQNYQYGFSRDHNIGKNVLQRAYQLDHFTTYVEIASAESIDNFFKKRPFIPYFKRGIRSTRYIEEPLIKKKPLNIKFASNCYVNGYWQSEKYFLNFSTVIREQFQLKKILDADNLKMLYLIQSVNAVSIHVRRGDYVNNVNTNNFHGICSLDYYVKAIEYFRSAIVEPHFFIFSDDIEWSVNNLKLGSSPATIVNINNEANGFKDMWLMRSCKHHIIANSSFSWWAAWLNPVPEKIVIAPRKWFNNPEHDTSDMLPANWIKF